MGTRSYIGKRVCFGSSDSSSWGNLGQMRALGKRIAKEGGTCIGGCCVSAGSWLTKLVELLLRLLAKLLLTIASIPHHAWLLHAHATVGSIRVAWVWLHLTKLIVAPKTSHLLGLLGHIRVRSASRGVTERIV